MLTFRMRQERREIGPLGEMEGRLVSRQTRLARRGGADGWRADRGLGVAQLAALVPLASLDQVWPLLELLLDDGELGLGRAQAVLGTGLLGTEVQNVANGETGCFWHSHR